MLDLKEEQEYTKLRKLAQELHIPIPEAFWTLEVFDKDGKLIQRHHQRSHSWVRNAYNLMMIQLAGLDAKDNTFAAGKISMKDTAATVQWQANRGLSLDSLGSSWIDAGYTYRGPAGDDDMGILVGSGTTAESFEDYVLATKIANGVGAGQLSYVEGDEVVPSYAALVFTATHVRYFNNNSGGNVDINEVCIVAYATKSPPDFYALMARDKLASTVTVPDTGQLKVTYTIQLTYPS